MIDDVSLKILKILQEKARITNAEVARQVEMAPSGVLERIRKLEQQGLIEGYEVRLNPESFAMGQAAFVFVETDGRDDLVGDALCKISCVLEVHQVAGPDGYQIKVRAEDAAAMGKLLRDEIRQLPGVTATRTSLVLATLKETQQIPLEGIAPE